MFTYIPSFLEGNLIHGKILAQHMCDEVAKEITSLHIKPCLAVILVGDDPASHIYVRHKQSACERVGIRSLSVKLPATISQKNLEHEIEKLNGNETIHGILLQLPLPDHLNSFDAIQAISPLKDVDGLHHDNLGHLFVREPRYIPCTPKGCMRILSHLPGIDLKGMRVTVVGRSILVGRPLSALLMRHHATVTVAHRYTKNLVETTRDADIVITAVGKPNLITADHIKEGAIVLDVGINRITDEAGKERIVGDVDFDKVAPKCHYITPVPGGIGPMTVACLMENVLQATLLHCM